MRAHLVVIAVGLAAACGGTGARGPTTVGETCTPTASSAPAPAAIPDLSWLSSATYVRVAHGQAGDLGASNDTFELVRASGTDRFQGLATHVEILNGRKPRSDARVIRDVALGPLLRALARATPPAPPAPNAVRLSVTDDYPRWDVLVQSENAGAERAVRFESPSTGDRPAPWFLWNGQHRERVEIPNVESIFEAIDPSPGP